MKRLNWKGVAGMALAIAIAISIYPPKIASAQDSPISSSSAATSDPPTFKSKPAAGEYRGLLDEIEAERKHIDALEKRVKELETSNVQLQQTQTAVQTSNTQTRKQVADIQKTLNNELGPFNFGDRINSIFGQHTFSMVGGVAAGFAFSRRSGENQGTLDFEVNPIIRLTDWMNFYSSFGAQIGVGGISDIGPSLANLEIFPFGWEVPVELVAGLFDMPFGDWYEDQSPPWTSPFITAPLLYGAEAIEPPSGMGLQARGGIQWGQTGQDVDYTLWVDSGPTFESAPGIGSIPTPVAGEALNELTGTNLSTHGKGLGARFRFYPIPVDAGWGRLEVMASTYNGHWLDDLWYHAWGVGYAYRVGAFRSRGEWAQSYRSMPSQSGAAAYPGCCGHDNRQGWYVQAGYSLYGIPHPDLGEWLERRFDKVEVLARYSGVNQRAIIANDIVTDPVFSFNGSPSVFSPHAREVALGVDYWIAPSIVWQTEADFELPKRGGSLYTFSGSSSTPTARPFGLTANDVAVLTQLSVGF